MLRTMFLLSLLLVTPAHARTSSRPLVHGGTVFTPTRTSKGHNTGQVDYQLSRSHPMEGGFTFETGDPENPYRMLRFSIPF